jgi:hypothetical protein
MENKKEIWPNYLEEIFNSPIPVLKGPIIGYHSFQLPPTNDNLEEIWLPILGYEGLYEISSLGRVKSLARIYISTKGHKQSLKEKILNSGDDSYGYRSVSLSKNNSQKTQKIHRLVAQTFIPNLNNYPQVNHINGIKIDNRVENLEWCNNSHNQIHAYKTGLNKGPNINGNSEGEKNHQSKLTKQQVLEIRGRKNFGRGFYTDLAKEFKISRANAYKIYKRQMWKHI